MTMSNTPRPQATSFKMPLGIIVQTTPHGAIIVFTRPDDGAAISVGSPVTIWDRDRHTGALARYRGSISEVSDTVAAFIIEETDIDPRWPNHLDPIQPGNCVYLAQPDSYEPVPHRLANAWELDHLMRLAQQFENESGISTGGRVEVPVVIRREDDYVLE